MLEKIINLVVVIKDFKIHFKICFTLDKITELEQLKVMVGSFKEYVQQGFYAQDKVSNYDFTQWIVANNNVWHCAQRMSYPDFYSAWHSQPSIIHLETFNNNIIGNSTTTQHLDFTQFPTTFRLAIANDTHLNQSIFPICIDGANFTNSDNPAQDIYIEMVEQDCSQKTQTPTTISSLKTYWRLELKNQINESHSYFFTSKADPLFSQTFLTLLSTLAGSICLIPNQTCGSVECISPHHPNLIDAILKRLRREISEAQKFLLN